MSDELIDIYYFSEESFNEDLKSWDSDSPKNIHPRDVRSSYYFYAVRKQTKLLDKIQVDYYNFEITDDDILWVDSNLERRYSFCSILTYNSYSDSRIFDSEQFSILKKILNRNKKLKLLLN